MLFQESPLRILLTEPQLLAAIVRAIVVTPERAFEPPGLPAEFRLHRRDRCVGQSEDVLRLQPGFLEEDRRRVGERSRLLAARHQ